MKYNTHNSAEVKQRIARVFAGTYGEEIAVMFQMLCYRLRLKTPQISDDEGENDKNKDKQDDDDVQEVSPPQAKKRRTPTKRDVNEPVSVYVI